MTNQALVVAIMNDPSKQPASLSPIVGVGVVVFRRAKPGLEVLLIRRGKAPGAGEWSIPGGKQEWGETVRETAQREIMEETGITMSGLKLIDVVDGLMRDSAGALNRHLTLVDFRADWAGGELRAGDDAADARWVPLGDLESYNLWSETLRIIRAGAEMD